MKSRYNKKSYALSAVLFVVTTSFMQVTQAGQDPTSVDLTSLPCESIRISGDRRSFGRCNFRGVRKSLRRLDARTFLDQHGASLGLDRGSADLKAISSKTGLVSVHSRFQQELDGIPIYGGYVSVHGKAVGNVYEVSSNYRNSPVIIGSRKASVTLQEAEAAAAEAAGETPGTPAELRLPTRAELVWYPFNRGFYRLAWQLSLYTVNLLGDFHTIVDANSGKVLRQENAMVFYETGHGYVYSPNPIQTSADTGLEDNNDAASAALNGLLEEVELKGLDPATGLLIGEFVDAASVGTNYSPQSTYPNADEPTREYFYDRNDVRFEQVVAYHAIDSVQRYIHSLGFDDDTGERNGIRDFPTRVNVHWFGSDSSFYSAGDDTLHFGDGGVDDAEDADIIIHEYGHAIQHDQNGLWPGLPSDGDMQAMGEGFSDYLAASFYAGTGDAVHQAAHAACVGEWDSTSYAVGDPTCLRRVDGGKHYPGDLTGEEHADGEIWSRALWDIRTALGGAAADKLILEHHVLVDSLSNTMPFAAIKMIQADANLNGGVNEVVLRGIFCDRGILFELDCNPQSAQTIQLETERDSFIHERTKDLNEGAHALLRVKGYNKGGSNANRALVGFDLSQIDLSRVKSAMLVLSVTHNDNQWSPAGGGVDALPLGLGFVEGNGRQAGVLGDDFSIGNGQGVTWECAIDNDVADLEQNCDSPWSGGAQPGVSGTTAIHSNGMAATVYWDITADLRGGVSRWLLKKRDEASSGRVYYHSREGASVQGNPLLAPRLLLEVYPPEASAG